MKKNRIEAGILAIACGFCISGCGDTGESSSAVSETTTTIAEAETQGETEAQAETEAQTEKPASDAKFAFEVVSTISPTIPMKPPLSHLLVGIRYFRTGLNVTAVSLAVMMSIPRCS